MTAGDFEAPESLVFMERENRLPHEFAYYLCLQADFFFFSKQELNYMAKGVKEDDTPELGEF